MRLLHLASTGDWADLEWALQSLWLRFHCWMVAAVPPTVRSSSRYLVGRSLHRGGLLLQWIASAPGVCALPGRHLFTSIAVCRIVTSISRPIAMPIAVATIAAIASAIAITDQRHHCYQYQPHTASRVPTTAATTCLECPLLASTIAHSHNNAMLLPQCLRIVTATVTRRCPRQPGVAYQVEWPTQRLPRTHAHTHARTPARPSANGTGSDFEALSRSQVLAAAVPRHGKARRRTRA